MTDEEKRAQREKANADRAAKKAAAKEKNEKAAAAKA